MSDSRYANAFHDRSSATHSVAPSDHSPDGPEFPAAARTASSTSSAGSRAPSDSRCAVTPPWKSDTHSVEPSDHSPDGNPLPPASSNPRSASNDPSSRSYARTAPERQSQTTHSVSPSDHRPVGPEPAPRSMSRSGRGSPHAAAYARATATR